MRHTTSTESIDSSDSTETTETTEPTVPSDLRVVAVAGPSDAGKTTLVERLVDALPDATRVATVKSIHHDLEPDEPGTDTHRHRTAGADAVVGVTPSFAFEVVPNEGVDATAEPDGSVPDSTADAAKRAALYDRLAGLAARDFDLVLVEGFADAPLPTVLVGDGDTGDAEDADRAVAGDVIATDADPFEDVLAAVRAETRTSTRAGTLGRRAAADGGDRR